MISEANGNRARSRVPLNAIRVFAEAARRLNFSLAARALGMTQAGVSQHVAALEAYLGQALFSRRGASLRLTDAGRLYFDTVQEAVTTIELSTHQFRQRSVGSERLVVRTSLYTFAVSVLVPALAGFRSLSTLPVEVITSLSEPGTGEEYDVLITRDLTIDDEGHWLLATEELVCVAAPALLPALSGKTAAEWPFIVTRSRPDVLAAWVNRLGVEPGEVRPVAGFEHYFLALPAAISGLGTVVVPRLLVQEYLRQGSLVEVGTPSIRTAVSYRAYINPTTMVPDGAESFCRWLKGVLRTDS